MQLGLIAFFVDFRLKCKEYNFSKIDDIFHLRVRSCPQSGYDFRKPETKLAKMELFKKYDMILT